MRNDFYVYVWKRPCGTPFYVGKGRGYRSKSLVGRSLHFLHIVDKMKRSGSEPAIEHVAEGLTESEAFAVEAALISSLGRTVDGGPLVNISSGGEGASGFTWPDECRATLREVNRRRGPLKGEFKGVSYDSEYSNWVAKILIDGKRVSLGRYPTPEEAAAAYDRAALDAWGEDCYLNMPDVHDISLQHVCQHRKKQTRAVSRHKSGPVRGGKYKGISYHKGTAKWVARIKGEGKQVHLGYYPTPEDAARAYDRAAYAAWGRDCYLNFPDEIPANDNQSPQADSEEPPPRRLSAQGDWSYCAGEETPCRSLPATTAGKVFNK